jgi:ubiquitin-conjugating enzyme E2 W
MSAEFENVMRWLVTFTMPEGSIYVGETYTLEFKFDADYPIESPDVIFHGASPDHEHIYSNGYICLSILYDDWTPSLKVSSVVLSIMSMMASAEQKSRPVNDASFMSMANGRRPKSFNWVFEDTSC